MEPEDQACREVYEAACITIDHLGQVHNDWRAFAKVLPYCPRFVVGPRMQRGDPGQVRGAGRLGERALSGAAATVVGPVAGGLWLQQIGVVVVLGDVIAVVLALAIFLGVGIVIAMVVFHEAEVDRHLAHRAGHCQSSVIPHRCSPGSRRVPRVGHYLTKACRLPSNAVPTRTCVAPSAIASSKSPVMPAEINVAAGYAALTRPATSASLRNAGRGGAPSGAMAITPPSSSPLVPATSAASAGTSAALAPPRSGSGCGSRSTWIRHVMTLPAARARLPSAPIRRDRSTEWTTSAYLTTLFALFT